MVEISIYFFREKGESFQIFKIPLSSNEDLLSQIIAREQEKVDSNEAIDYFQVYNPQVDYNTYFSISGNHLTEKIKQLTTEIVLNNTSIPSLTEFSARRGSKDKFPFKGFAILKKGEDGTFSLGIESLGERLKIYKKKFLWLNLGDDNTVSPITSTVLIPDYVTVLINGQWDVQEVSNLIVSCRSKHVYFFEGLFGYNQLWKEQAKTILDSQENIVIDDAHWADYNNDIRNSRKFVRCFNSVEIEEGFEHVKDYYEIPRLRGKLGFVVSKEDENLRINISSSEQMKRFIDAFQNHILQNPNDTEFYRADHPERL